MHPLALNSSTSPAYPLALISRWYHSARSLSRKSFSATHTSTRSQGISAEVLHAASSTNGFMCGSSSPTVSETTNPQVRSMNGRISGPNAISPPTALLP
jgi:hypothetical protein